MSEIKSTTEKVSAAGNMVSRKNLTVPEVFDKLMYVKSLCEGIQVNINEILASLKNAHDSLEKTNNSLMIICQEYANMTGLSVAEVMNIVESRWDSEGVLNYPNRYWREKGFEGWRVRTGRILKETDRLMSLNEIIETTEERDPLEIKRLESAISNALTTGLKNNFFIAYQSSAIRGRLYGIPAFLNEGYLKRKYIVDLSERYDEPNMVFVLDDSGKLNPSKEGLRP
jgi:hypothetical protein